MTNEKIFELLKKETNMTESNFRVQRKRNRRNERRRGYPGDVGRT